MQLLLQISSPFSLSTASLVPLTPHVPPPHSSRLFHPFHHLQPRAAMAESSAYQKSGSNAPLLLSNAFAVLSSTASSPPITTPSSPLVSLSFQKANLPTPWPSSPTPPPHSHRLTTSPLQTKSSLPSARSRRLQITSWRKSCGSC